MSVVAVRPIPADLAETLKALGVADHLISLSPTAANAARLILDAFPAPDQIAVRVLTESGDIRCVRIDELTGRAAQFARLLIGLGVQPGDRVAGLLPRDETLPVVLLGTLMAGAVYQPLFTAFGPAAISSRLAGSGAKLVVTDQVNRPKLDGLGVKILVAGETAGAESLDAQLAEQSEERIFVTRSSTGPMLMMFTSGTTGTPKGVVVPIRALLSFATYMKLGIGLEDGGSFWNLADPGWAYGLYYGVIGPLITGSAVTFMEAPFSVEGSYELIRRLDVKYLAGAPTAFRRMANSPHIPPGGLRTISSAGEPLDVPTRNWLERNLGARARDHFGQTELGMVLCDTRSVVSEDDPSEMGRPLPGFEAAILDAEGLQCEAGQAGLLAIHRRSPLLWFEGYAGMADQPWLGDHYVTGDLANCSVDGTFRYISRADDVITSSGYRISPSEVENALLDHPAVVEAAVVGIPDRASTEIVKAFLVLSANAEASDNLAAEIRAYVKARLAAYSAPREIAFVTELPRTESGKIQRHKLREVLR